MKSEKTLYDRLQEIDKSFWDKLYKIIDDGLFYELSGEESKPNNMQHKEYYCGTCGETITANGEHLCSDGYHPDPERALSSVLKLKDTVERLMKE